MISSMTGFGRGVALTGDKKIQIDIKSVNSKQLDVTMRLPSVFKEKEVTCRQDLSKYLGRGKIEVWATIENSENVGDVEFNRNVIENYKLQLEEMGSQLGLGTPQDWYTLLLRMPDSIKNKSQNEDDEAFNLGFDQALHSAITALIDFRNNEGRRLYDFFKLKISEIYSLLEQVTPFEAERVVKIRERLTEQLCKLESIEYDQGRLEQELIFYIEKLDVTEEKVRLKSHLDYFLETLDDTEREPSQGSGKKLSFIAQEMGREINTLGSKSNHAEMQKIVVKMKDELEQIKEQVLNVL